MINLLDETICELVANGKDSDDVLWVGDKDGYTTWSEFVSKADEEYDNGYGGNEVQDKLVIVGSDWWLERGEYDGSEWWEFKSLPKKPSGVKKLANLFDIYEPMWEQE